MADEPGVEGDLDLRPPHQKINVPPQLEGQEGGGDEGQRRQAAEMTPAYTEPTTTSGHHYPRIFKSARQVRWQLRLEWALLKKEWRWILAIVVMEYIHLVSRNLVYYIQGIVYDQNRKDGTPTNDHDFPIAPIEDLGFMALGSGGSVPQSWERVVNIFIGFLGVFALVLCLVRLLVNMRVGGPKVAITGRDAPDRHVIVIPAPLVLVVKRMAVAGVVIIPLRCLTFLVTLLPPPAPHCQHSWTPPKSFQKVFNPLIAPRTGCGDQMFSGHMLHGTILALMVLRYFPYHRILPAMAFIDLALLALSLLVFRSHYTADVLTALYVTAGAWYLLPREPETLNKYGIRANVLVHPNYLTAGAGAADRERAREILGEFEEVEETGVGEEEQQPRRPSRTADLERGEGGEAGAVAGGGDGGGCVGRCVRCGEQVRGWGLDQAGRLGLSDRGARGRGQRRRTYVPPLPPSCPSQEFKDNTESERAVDRLPW